MAKYTNYRVVVTEPAFPGGEYVITRRSLHNDYTHVWLQWRYVYMGKYPPIVGFSRSQEQAWKGLRRTTNPDVDAVRIVQEIMPADKS